MKAVPRRRFRLTLSGQKNLMGYLFTLPFTLGFILFVLSPIYRSIIFSISELAMASDGYTLHYVGLENYAFALQVHTTFVRQLTESTAMMLGNVFWVLVFAFLAANILNEEFRGRTLVRMVFFLPVVMSAGIILKLEQQDYMIGVLEHGLEEVGSFLSGDALTMYLMQIRIPEFMLDSITAAVDRIPQIINASGIQILIFLAGLQSIPPSLYEAAEVEGATGWEIFWIITLPLLSPLILTAIIYTIVDFFTMPANEVVQLIQDTTFGGAGFGIGTAMTWIYFGSIAVVLAIAFALLSRVIVYQD